jgi:hypothetical protein
MLVDEAPKQGCPLTTTLPCFEVEVFSFHLNLWLNVVRYGLHPNQVGEKVGLIE